MNKQVAVGALLAMGVGRTASAEDLVLDMGSATQGRVSIELVGSEAAWANSLSAHVVGGPVAHSGDGLVVRTLSNPPIPLSGCNLQPAVTLEPVFLLSEKKAGLLAVPPDLTPTQRGCRVSLDFLDTVDPDPENVFPNGTILRFLMCSQTNGDPTCEHTWSSNNAGNGADAGLQFQWFSFSPSHPCYYDTSGVVPYDAANCQQPAGRHVITTEIVPNKVWRMEWEDLPHGTDGPYGDFDDLIVNIRVDIDSDGDGLFDDWETAGGIDIDNNGTIDLPLPGAHVNEKDIYLHLDYMSCSAVNTSPTVAGTTYSFPNVYCPGGTHSHQPSPSVIAALEDAFMSSPGGPIHLHVDPVMTAVPHTQWMTIKFGDLGCGSPTCPNPDMPCTTCTEANAGTGETSCVRSFDEYKKAYYGNNNPKRYAYHYGIIGHRLTSAMPNTGCGEMPGNDFYVSVGGNQIDGLGTPQEIAGTIMHELGHNLYLAHGGNPEGSEKLTRYKPNYPSVMSYTFQTDGLYGQPGTNGLPNKIDYSAGALASLNESSLVETANLWPSQPGNTRWIYNNGTSFVTPVPFAGGHDWNQSGGPLQGVAYGQSVDEDTAGPLDTHTDHNDWANLRFEFQNTRDYEDGAHENSVPGGEASFAETHPPIADAGYVADGNPNSLGDLYACYLGENESLDGSGSIDVAGGSVEDFSWSWDDAVTPDASGEVALYSCTSRLGAVPLYLTVTDDDGISTTDSAPLQVTLNGGSDQTLECQSPAGATFTLGTSPLLPSTGFAYVWADNGNTIGTTAQTTHIFSIATHPVTVQATDTAAPVGDVSQSDGLTITVQDTTPPVISEITPSEVNLWPPNHHMHDIVFTPSVTDLCDPSPTCTILQITSNEPETGCGSGNFTPDYIITGALTAQIRAERCGSGDGRNYTIKVQCTDDYGNSSTGNGEVVVHQGCDCH